MSASNHKHKGEFKYDSFFTWKLNFYLKTVFSYRQSLIYKVFGAMWQPLQQWNTSGALTRASGVMNWLLCCFKQVLGSTFTQASGIPYSNWSHCVSTAAAEGIDLWVCIYPNLWLENLFDRKIFQVDLKPLRFSQERFNNLQLGPEASYLCLHLFDEEDPTNIFK